MEIKFYTDALHQIINNTGAIAKKYYHKSFGGTTSHMFLSMTKYLSTNKADANISKIQDKLKDILHKYNVDGKAFVEAFTKLYPMGPEPVEGESYKIEPSPEFQMVLNNLRNRALEEKRSMDIPDLIVELFNIDGNKNAYTLFTVMSNITGSDGQTVLMYKDIIANFMSAAIAKPSMLEQVDFIQNMNREMIKKPKTIIGGDKLLNQMYPVLVSRMCNNVALVGPAGTGKSDAVKNLVQRINSGDVPDRLKNKVIYKLDTNALVAGTMYRGMLEQKLKDALALIKEDPNAIIFVDEGHTLIDAGSSSDQASGIAQTLKPALSDGEIQMIIATTNDEYSKFITQDKAFARRFNKINVEEPSVEETKLILKGLLEDQYKFYNKKISDELVDRIVYLSNKYTSDSANPAKAIKILDYTYGYALCNSKDKEDIELDDVIESIKNKFNIHISEDSYKDTVDRLHEYILGQDEPLNRICRRLKAADVGLVEPNKPLFSAILCGPTGVGKTETAKIIAERYFGSAENNLIIIDGGNYTSPLDVSKLIGTSAGYVGYDQDPYLTKQVKQYPNSVILFDEVEKMHPSIMDTLLNILDRGELTDNKGDKVSFKNTIILFTSNLGCKHGSNTDGGLGLVKINHQKSDIKSAIQGFFRVEFLNRITEIVQYNYLSNDIAKDLIERYRKYFCELPTFNRDIKFTKKDIESIIEEADIETFGARKLQTVVQDRITDLI